MHTEKFNVMLLGGSTLLEVDIEETWRTNIHFSCLGTPYSFTVTTWSKRGLADLIHIFHLHEERDAVKFGRVHFDSEGNAQVIMNRQNKVNMVLQACSDIIACLDLIVERYPQSLLDYAVWYRERHQEHDTYHKYITGICARCIVDSEFSTPSVTWDLVTFPSKD